MKSVFISVIEMHSNDQSCVLSWLLSVCCRMLPSDVDPVNSMSAVVAVDMLFARCNLLNCPVIIPTALTPFSTILPCISPS